MLVDQGFAPEEHRFEVFRHIEPSVRPCGLLAGDKVFDAADEAVVAGILEGIAVAGQRGDVDAVVHERGITEPGADDL